MLLFLDYAPLVAFLVVYKGYGIYAATAVLMATMPLVPLAHWLLTRKVSRMHLLSTALVLVFGTITIALRNPLFIAWKPTVFYTLLGIACIASLFVGEKTLIERLLGQAVELQRAQWHKLTAIWAVFFFLLGGINLYVYYNFPEATWVNFKLYGLLGLTVVFIVLQSIWLGAITSRNDGEASDGGN